MARDIYDNNQRRRAAFREAVYLEWGRVCVWCRTAEATTVDHIVPRAKLRVMFAGDPEGYAAAVFDVANGRPSCKPCNSSRGERPVPKWMTRRGASRRPPTPPSPTTRESDSRWHV